MRLHLHAASPPPRCASIASAKTCCATSWASSPAPETRALLTPILGATSGPDRTGGRGASATPRDLMTVARKIEDLSAACDAAQAQLVEAMTLLRELTAELRAGVQTQCPRGRRQSLIWRPW